MFPPIDGEAARAWSWRRLWMGRAIQAPALLPAPTRLETVGPPEPGMRPRLRALTAARIASGRPAFAAVPHRQVRARYRRADATFLTSELDYEAFRLVQLGAMASACALVTTGVGGSAEYCRDGDNCLVVPPGDPVALAAAVRRLADDPLLRGRLVDGGLKAAAAFTLDRRAARIEQVLVAAVNRTDPSTISRVGGP